MKIGILTFHCAHNYGAVLQAYALQTYLQSIGHDAYIIDYRPRYLTDVYRVFNYHRWVSRNPLKFAYRTLRELRYLPVRRQRFAAFEHFINTRLHLSPYRQPDDLKSFDLVFLGSDQIWNPNLTGRHYDDLYWGLSVPVPAASYAASSRVVRNSRQDKAYMEQALSKLLAVSVREASLREVLAPLCNKPIAHVLDPTLLIPSSSYTPILADCPGKSKPYVLVYQIASDPNLAKIAKSIALQIGGYVIEVLSNPVAPRYKGCKTIATASPETFLSCIKNASCVVTSSFHGTALSIIFRRPFYTVKLGYEIDNRAMSLLEKAGCSERMIGNHENVVFSQPNFDAIAQQIAKCSEESYAYLHDAIKKARERKYTVDPLNV